MRRKGQDAKGGISSQGMSSDVLTATTSIESAHIGGQKQPSEDASNELSPPVPPIKVTTRLTNKPKLPMSNKSTDDQATKMNTKTGQSAKGGNAILRSPQVLTAASIPPVNISDQKRTSDDDASKTSSLPAPSTSRKSIEVDVTDPTEDAEQWNADSDTSSPTIFPTNGERRKRQVKDDFDWLRPKSNPANVAKSSEVYASNYHFHDGFITANKLVSTSIFAIPKSVNDCCFVYTHHSIVMDHPLCNVEQDVQWLVKPVGNLLNRMHASALRPNTRSSFQDACLGQDLFLYSAYVSASDFVCTTDDVELVDLVDMTDSSKKIDIVRTSFSQQ